MNTFHESWEKFLHPETLKGNLIAISLFITAFENFKDRIIEKPESLFLTGFDGNGFIIDKDKYQKEVLSLSQKKSYLYASLLWFRKMDAIDDADIITFDSIRKHRNELAHKPMEFLANPEQSFDVTKFQNLITLLSKIEKWWFVNFEAAIDPDMLPDGTDPDKVISGSILLLQMMLDIALGNEPEDGFYYNVFKAQKT